MIFSKLTSSAALGSVICIATVLMPQAAQAEPGHAAEESAATSGSGAVEEDIIVTARRRGETLQDIPVSVDVVGGESLELRGVTNMEGFARTIPQLFLANSSGGVQGGAIGLRGISAGDGNPFGDQAVAFNIDGVQIARATPRTLSEFDLRQIEVMKGPQALFFGKNSPGGVIAIHTADPTPDLSAGVRASYELNAREVRAEAFISGPLTPTLGGRIAISTAKMRGWVRNAVTPGTIYNPEHGYGPRSREFNGRVTLKFEPSSDFDARLKFSYGNIKNDGPAANAQLIYCPTGAPQLGGLDDCRANDRITKADLGGRVGTGGANTITGAPIMGIPLFGDGRPRGGVEQYLSGLDINYKINDVLSLSSTTGFYKAQILLSDNFNSADTSAPARIVGAYISTGIREISEEVRITSSFNGPLDFMVGAYFQDQHLTSDGAGFFNAVNPVAFYPPAQTRQDGTALSAFASVSYKPLSTVELSGGMRYSKERKQFAIKRIYAGTLAGGATFQAGDNVPTAVPKRTFDNWSPEAVLTWRPIDDVTAFIGWKRGFMSGGFNGGGAGTQVAFVPDRSYEQEVVQGFEGGLKTTLLDGRAHLNFAAYSYDVDGLQVTAVLPGPPPVQVINNAAAAKVKGVEVSGDINFPFGVSLRSSLAYNDSRYTNFTASPCYSGQSIALGCNGTPAPSGLFTTQDLSGQKLVRAPSWGAAIGGDYRTSLSSDLDFVGSLDANYSSGYFTDALNFPGAYQKGYWLLDASMHFKAASGFSVGLIGRNLTNKYYYQRSTGTTFTGGAAGGVTSSLPDYAGSVSRGRELRVELGFRF